MKIAKNRKGKYSQETIKHCTLNHKRVESNKLHNEY